MLSKSVMIIGIGFHARRIYIPTVFSVTKNLPVKLVAGVDILEQKKVIEEYFENTNLDIKMLYVDKLKENGELTKESIKKLDKLVKELNISGVIISTEPLAHKAYAMWALKNGLNILMDKPITTRKFLTTDVDESIGLENDFKELLNSYDILQKKKSTIFSINTQRRYDTGFIKVIELIKEVKEKFNVPVTSIQAMYSDGTWVHPNEILTQLSHPYLHGYGKCSHSGYHILDIVWQFYKAGSIKTKMPNQMEVYSAFVLPSGFNLQISQKDYKKYFGKNYVDTGLSEDEYRERTKDYGEIDVYSIVKLMKDNENICNISINMMHNSFSRRSWGIPNKDLYKGNGRVKHQMFVIQQGPFQSIQIHNYQASDDHDKDNSNQFDVGGNNHFDIFVFRNSGMFGEETSYYKISNKDLQTELSTRLTIEKTKDLVIIEFIDFLLGKKTKKDIISNIETHEIPVKMMRGIYQSNSSYVNGKNPVIRISLLNDRAIGLTKNIINYIKDAKLFVRFH